MKNVPISLLLAISAACSLTTSASGADVAATELATIYSNFGDEPESYDCYTGWAIAGSDLNSDGAYSMAMPFTSSTDAVVKKIKVPLFHISGTNTAVISLRADLDGLPGAVLAKVQIGKIPDGADCREPKTMKLAEGIPINAGKRYWVAVSTPKSATDTYEGWNFSGYSTSGPIAYAYNGAWSRYTDYPSAFKVLGTLSVPD